MYTYLLQTSPASQEGVSIIRAQEKNGTEKKNY